MHFNNSTHLLARQRGGNFIAVSLRVTSCLLLLCLSIPQRGFSQYNPDFEELSVSLNVANYGATEIPAIIKNEALYLSVTELFDFIKIENRTSPNLDSVSGFFINPQDPYLIDGVGYNIRYQKRIIDLDPEDLIVSGGQMFLHTQYLGDVFGLDCVFSIRNLHVELSSRTELPVVRALRLERMRLNYNPHEKLFKADTAIGKNYRFFNLGAADWSIIASQQVAGSNYTRLNLGLGGIFAGGELNVALIHTLNRPFVEKQQFYLWRYADNDRKVVRQVMAGKISANSISSIFDPVVGVQITNTPTYVRKSYGTYLYSAYVQPNWVVELYVNNAFVDYVKSDAVGLITYNIPLSYGTTEVTTRYIGPWGEAHDYTQNFVVPYNILPENVFEYKVSAGVVEDSTGSIYSQGRMSYGLTEKVTVGGGVEYLSSISTVRGLPFLNTSVRISPNMLFSAEYVYGVRYKGLLSYQLPSQLQFDLNYVKYDQPQEAVKFNYAEERSFAVAMPLRYRNTSAYSRLAIRQNILGSTEFINAEWTVSLATRGVNLNVASYAYYNKNSDPFIYSKVSTSLQLPGKITLTPRVVYEYRIKKFTSLNLGATKYFSPYFSVNAAFEQRFDFPERYLRAGIKYDFAFARFTASVNNSRNHTTFFQTAGGSLIYEKELKYLDFGKHSNVGRGGVAFSAYLDVNGNGRKDIFESNVKGLNVRVNGAGRKQTETGASVIFTGLEAYRNYAVTLNGDDFENLTWKIEKPQMDVVIDPNQIKKVEIPISVLGEVSGTVFFNDKGAQTGMGRIKIGIYDKKSTLIATVLTEEDGYFSYLGLKPGKYTARIDTSQLAKLQLRVDVERFNFAVRSSQNGDVVDNLEFVLEPLPEK